MTQSHPNLPHSLGFSHTDTRSLDQMQGSGLLQTAAAVLERMRAQLSGGLIVAIALPAVILRLLFPEGVYAIDVLISFGAALASLIAGFTIFRKLSAYGTSCHGLISIASFTASFASVAAALWLLNLLPSPVFLSISWALTVVWFWFVSAATAYRRPGIYIVPPGTDLRKLAAVPNATWINVKEVSEAAGFGNIPVVSDTGAITADTDWPSFLCEAAINGRTVLTPDQLMETSAGRLRISGGYAQDIARSPGQDAIYPRAKRYVDVLTSLVALVLLCPVMLLLAVIIRMESPGPAIFRQKRMGYRGREFTVYKFRSMRAARETGDALSRDMTQTDDDRITPIGRIIRKVRIDELPQIINILKGEMSWIGPRPETVNLSRHYERNIPHYRYRHMVRPGITGWAQVRQGHVVSVEDVSTKLEYDFFYVKHLSLWLDILIAVLTVRVVLTGHGAK
ncbi:UDP-glucose lipid carrier transferase [Hyphomonas polymorpha PS728]|uniref:UDP-glucose lipid carrier transferase n=1 Tax=Hyphomonas polymorpha PS728 TaxID=1280954 RepID=A0A062VED8_9PROT|nr:sugar transferase [Hyphomonas polymorpha]KCZ96816.1 UDP-glucose lipid carrier transferase [Hyphomonas polymorpha PS728]